MNVSASLQDAPTGGRIRLERDLAARRAAFAGARNIEVPVGGEQFWETFASFVGPARPTLTPIAMPDYPPPHRGAALWYSGGVESTYTQMKLHSDGIFPELLRIEDFEEFRGPDRDFGQIHFLCAAIGAALGFGPIYLGMERSDLLLGTSRFSRGYVERHPIFADWWSSYQPDHAVVTVCGHLHKEEILTRLAERDVPVTGTCDRLRDGNWCAKCYKCFEYFYTAKAVDIVPTYRLNLGSFRRFYAEYRRFIDSGFADNFNNAYQHYVRLQITYGLRFDENEDCEKVD